MAAISLKWLYCNFIPIHHRRFIFAYIPMFLGSANSLNVFLSPPNYDIIGKYNMAAKIAAVLSITLICFIVILEIILVSIPRFSRLLNTLEQLLLRLDGYLIVQFKVKGVQVLRTTPNFISYKQLFSNTSFQALTV